MRIKLKRFDTVFKSNKFVYQNIRQFVFLINPLITVEFSGKRWQSIGIDTVFITRPVLSTSSYKKRFMTSFSHSFLKATVKSAEEARSALRKMFPDLSYLG